MKTVSLKWLKAYKNEFLSTVQNRLLLSYLFMRKEVTYMKRRMLVFFVIASILLMPAHATPIQRISARPNIQFSGTNATCSVVITASSDSDKISATMELWQGNTLVASWSDTGYYRLSLNETATVAKGKSYKLVINYSINGVEKTPISVSKTNT